MAAYEYVALDARGKQKKGVLEGDNGRQIRQSLRELGLTALSVEPVAEKEQKISRGSRQKISASELALITRQLSTLVQSALPLEEALKAVSQQCDKARLKSLVLSVRSNVVEGHTLADSLANFPHVFDELFCAMVSAGEKSGHLDEVLMRLADYTEQRQQMKQKIQIALLYPSILTLIAIGVVSGLLSFVVPKVVEQFANAKAQLPLMTRVLIGISDFIRSYGLWLLAALALLIVVARWLLKREELRFRFHAALLNLPVMGKVIRGLNSARFARTLSIMVASSVPLLDGLRISSEVMTNLRLRRAVEEAAIQVKEGSSLRVALQNVGYFPPMMLHMIASGENSGQLEQMLTRAADNQDREFEGLVAVTLGLFEPVIILVMGAVVMFIVAAILLPIFQLNNLVK